MKTRAWVPGKKEWDFIRENICMISPQEMADHFGVTLSILNQEKVEAGIIIEDFMETEASCAEYELDRFLNRFERAKQWSIGLNSYPCDKRIEGAQQCQ